MRILSLLIIGATMVSSSARGSDNEPKQTQIQGHTMYAVLMPGDIPAIFDPEFVPVAKTNDKYYANEPLIAVVDGETAKGYSTWHLDNHEVVNDYINGEAITVTW